MQAASHYFPFQVSADEWQQTDPTNDVSNECKQGMWGYIAIEQPTEVSTVMLNG